MSIFNIPLMIGGLGDARTLSQQELAQRAQEQWAFLRNAESHWDIAQLLANYRPPVYVPAGWAEWFSIGDELH